MQRLTLLLVLGALVVASCTGARGTEGTPANREPGASHVTTLPPSTPSPTATEPADLALPRLPTQGIVIERQRRIVLLDLSGRQIAHLRRFRIEDITDAPGPVLVVRHQTVYLLRVRAHLLHPLRPWRVDRFRTPDDLGLNIPPPHGATRANGEVIGHWRWARFSPDLSWVLAQWSGECEVPTAMMVPADGHVPVPVTGEWGLRHAPESFALGWTLDGRALVDLPHGACGMGASRPGVYLFSSPGHATLLFATRGFVRMWGTA